MTRLLDTPPGVQVMDIINRPGWDSDNKLIKKVQRLIKQHDKIVNKKPKPSHDDLFLFLRVTNIDGRVLRFDTFNQIANHFNVNVHNVRVKSETEEFVKRGQLEGWKIERVYE